MPILPPRTLQLITDHQLVDLDLATLTKEQLNELFLRQDDKEETKRLALLSSKQVQDSLEKLNPSLLKFITNTQLRDLDVSILPQEILEKLFCYINGETEKDRLASLATPQLQAILPKLASYQLTCIPNHTLKALDLSNLTEAQVQSIFDITDHKALRERLNALPLEQLQAILPKLLIFQLKEISNETLSLLDLSGLSVHQLQCLFTIMNIEATQKRFASLSTKQIQSIISKLNGLQLKWIPSEIFKALDLSLLSEPQIQALFSWIDTEATRKRLAELTPCQLKAIKHKFSSYQLKLLPEALA